MNSVPQETLTFPVTLQRHAFGPRLVARAGDVWRAMQDVVVDQSSSVGWTPERYVEANGMFVVRTMTVRHHREVRIQEPLVGRTWPSRARRQMLFTRQVRLFAGSGPEIEASAEVGKALAGLSEAESARLKVGEKTQATLDAIGEDFEKTRERIRQIEANALAKLGRRSGEPVASATQEWAYLTRDLQPTRAGKEIFDAFKIFEGYPEIELPSFVANSDQPLHVFDFTVWHGWMDPHGHANHAAYVDYCDEGVARVVAAEGGDPQRLVPIAESVHFRAAIGAGELITVETTLAGHVQGGRVFKHRVLSGEKVCATATTVRGVV